MRKLLIKELRERSCIPGKQKTWIAKLSDDQLYEIYHRIKKWRKGKINRSSCTEKLENKIGIKSPFIESGDLKVSKTDCGIIGD